MTARNMALEEAAHVVEDIGENGILILKGSSITGAIAQKIRALKSPIRYERSKGELASEVNLANDLLTSFPELLNSQVGDDDNRTWSELKEENDRLRSICHLNSEGLAVVLFHHRNDTLDAASEMVRSYASGYISKAQSNVAEFLAEQILQMKAKSVEALRKA